MTNRMDRSKAILLRVTTAVMVATFLLVLGCDGKVPADDSSLEAVAPRCTGADCEERDVSRFGLFSEPARVPSVSVGETASMEDVLEQGLLLAGASPVHMT